MNELFTLFILLVLIFFGTGWFAGFTSELLTVVWVGYDDNARTGLTGATGALPIWVQIMKREAAADALRRLVADAGGTGGLSARATAARGAAGNRRTGSG